MVAKLSLLLAISHEPELLVLDEPMSGLDPLVREEFLDGVLKTICRGDSTVLFSSHSIDDVQRLADNVGIMYHGKLLVHRPLDDLLGSTISVRSCVTVSYHNSSQKARFGKNVQRARVVVDGRRFFGGCHHETAIREFD